MISVMQEAIEYNEWLKKRINPETPKLKQWQEDIANDESIEVGGIFKETKNQENDK